MKKLLLFCGALLFSLTIIAQELVQKNAQALTSNQDLKMPSKAKDFFYNGKNYVRKTPLVAPAGTWHYVSDVTIEDGYPVGLTNYDLQSNGGSRSAIIEHSDNHVSLVFTQYHGSTTTYPERGTGYAYFNGTDWLTNAQSGNERVEGTVRTGWGTLLSNGTEEFVVSHGLGTGAYGRYQNIGTSVKNWAGVSNLTVSGGLLWPRSATNGTNYYMVGCTGAASPYGFKFFKSTDAGRNWTSSDLPTFSTKYYSGSGDGYSIDAKDNIVAIVFFGEWADVTLWKSTDYGQTFTATTIMDFPVDKYNLSVGPIIDKDNNSVADTVMTTDGCGDVIIDKDGKVHVVFGIMRVLDETIETTGDPASSYFPYTDGILYWNESMPAGVYNGGVSRTNFHDLYIDNQVEEVAWTPDLNGNNSYDFVSVGATQWPFGTYYSSLASHPTLGTDIYGNIFMVFDAVMEGTSYVKATATPNAQQYRYCWLRYRTPWGEWSDFYNLSEQDQYAENVYADMVSHIKSDNIYYWSQWDNEPGLNLQGDEDAITDNYILGKVITLTYSDSVYQAINTPAISATVAPNPVMDVVTISSNSKCNYSIIDINGREVLAGTMQSKSATINVEGLQSGVYFVRLSSENGTTTQKIIKK